MRAALLIFALLSPGCGPGSDAFLTDVNVCRPDPDAAAAADTTDYSSESFANMYGTAGESARLAQRIEVFDRTEVWALSLRLRADERPGNGVAVGLSDNATYPELTHPKSAVPGDMIIDASRIPTRDAAWVTVQTKPGTILEPGSVYWLTLTPLYYHSEPNRVGWSFVTGTGLVDYDINLEAWFNAPRKAAVRLIGCAK